MYKKPSLFARAFMKSKLMYIINNSCYELKKKSWKTIGGGVIIGYIMGFHELI